MPKMMMKNFIWIANNLTKDNLSDIDEIAGIINIFHELIGIFLDDIQDEPILIEIVDGLRNIAKCGNSTTLELVSGINQEHSNGYLISTMCSLLDRKNEMIFAPVLQYVGSILVSDDKRIADKIVLNGSLDKVVDITFSSNQDYQKQCLWMLSNLSASGTEYSKVIIHNQVMDRIILMASSNNINVKHEALWSLTNCITCSGPAEVNYLFCKDNHACMMPLLKGLTFINHAKLIQSIIEALCFFLNSD